MNDHQKSIVVEIALFLACALAIIFIITSGGCTMNNYRETTGDYDLMVSRWTFCMYGETDAVEVVSPTSSVAVGDVIVYPDPNSVQAAVKALIETLLIVK